MNNNNDAAIIQFLIGGMVIGFIAMAIVIAGIFIALGAVASFVIAQWLHIYRYEGSTPVWSLLAATFFVAVPCGGVAAEQLELMRFYLDRNNDQWTGALFTAIISTVLIAAPTAAYWIYRLIKPISHFRIGTIEHWHDQYHQGNITRSERDAFIKQTIEIGDVALEQQISQARRQPETPATIIEHAPAHPDENLARTSDTHPRDAFDIPTQRVDG